MQNQDTSNLVAQPQDYEMKVRVITVLKFHCRDAPRGGAGGAAAPPDFGRSEGAAGQRRRAALLPAPPDF